MAGAQPSPGAAHLRRVIPGVTGPLKPREARWGRRAGAAVVDLLVYGVSSGLMAGAGWAVFLSTCEGTVDTQNLVCVDGTPSPMANVLLVMAYIVPVVVALLNEVVLQGWRGYTLGKGAFGLRVVHDSSRGAMGFWVSFARFVLLLVMSAVTLGVNLVLPLWNKETPTLHDRVLGTVVVRTE